MDILFIYVLLHIFTHFQDTLGFEPERISLNSFSHMQELGSLLLNLSPDSCLNESSSTCGTFHAQPTNLDKFDKIEFHEYYIIFRNAISPDILENKLNESIQMDCRASTEHVEERKEYRNFGNSQYEENAGHEVMFLDDCLSDEMYDYFYNTLSLMLEYVRVNTLQRFKDSNDPNKNENDMQKLWKFYDWGWCMEQMLEQKLHSRVLEYLRYTPSQGHIGWHKDYESNVTMVTLLNDDTSFEGAGLQFHEDPANEDDDDDDVDLSETIHLKQGDIILFPSEVAHVVWPITQGVREVLVIEFWNVTSERDRKVGRWSSEVYLPDADTDMDWTQEDFEEVVQHYKMDMLADYESGELRPDLNVEEFKDYMDEYITHLVIENERFTNLFEELLFFRVLENVENIGIDEEQIEDETVEDEIVEEISS